jgi:hypothetical protein
MTEGLFQATRKVMQTANYLRGAITESKGIVAKWTAIEDSHRKHGNDNQADGARKMLDKAFATLEANRKRFSDLKLPPEDVANPKEKWVAALDSDSFNYEPKKITEDRFLEANAEGMTMHDTQALAQNECNLLNSQ